MKRNQPRQQCRGVSDTWKIQKKNSYNCSVPSRLQIVPCARSALTEIKFQKKVRQDEKMGCNCQTGRL